MNLNIDPPGFYDAVGAHSDAVYPHSDEHDTDGSLCFRFTRREVATADIGRFFALIAPQQPSAVTLRLLQGTLVIQLPSAAARHDEPFLCETTRVFCRTLYEAFPAWAFFFSLQNLTLWKMVLALVQEAQVVQRDRAWQTRIILSDDALDKAIANQVSHALEMSRLADLGQPEADRLLVAINQYFSQVRAAYCSR